MVRIPPSGGQAIPPRGRPFAGQTAHRSAGKFIATPERPATSLATSERTFNVNRLVSQLGIEDPLTNVLARGLEVPIRELYAVLWRTGIIEIID
jgi:hypothetical protein